MKIEMASEDLRDAMEAVKVSGREEAVITLEDDGWIIKSRGPGDVIMAAVFTPSGAMEEYDRGEYSKIGIKRAKMEGFLNGAGDYLSMWMEERALHMDDGDTHLRLATVNPDSIEGDMKGAPDIKHEVSFKAPVDVIKSFVNKADEVLTTGHYFVSARKSGLFLYAEGDNGQIDRFIPWDNFEEYNIDWTVDNEGPRGSITPSVHEGTDCILSIEWTQELTKISGEATIGVGNHIPIRLLYDKSEDGEEGMKISLIQTPRIDQGGQNRIPDKVIEEYT